MPCDFFRRGTWGDPDICEVTKQKLTYDTVNRLCNTWGTYTECEDYKRAKQNCYLTSAACAAQGDSFDDNCYELQVLRKLRDEYVRVHYPEDVAHYYEIAPRIIATIETQSNADAFFKKIYTELVVPCVKFIEEMKYERAYALYKKYSLNLEKRFRKLE